MILIVQVEAGPSRGWIEILCARIADIDGITIIVERSATNSARSVGADALLCVETVLERQKSTRWTAKTNQPLSGHHKEDPPIVGDLRLDLTGDAVATSDTPVWRLAFDGHPGGDALLAALFAGRAPVVTLTEAGRIVASGRVGTESHDNLLAAFEDGLARTTTLIVAALTGVGPVLSSSGGHETTDRCDPSLRAVPGYAVLKAARKIGNGVRRLRYRRRHWRIGWRRLGVSDLIDQRVHPQAGWTDIPDDGTRFYADPFPIEYEGRTILFVEDYEYSRGKALISAVAFGPDGPIGTPVPVLDEPYHLSYPFVFFRDGAHWLVPESCANGTVDLYRATAFPGGWVKEATLLSGVVASDATLIEHAGRWWMFATVREGMPEVADVPPRGSYSDALHLWSAPDFRGPWRPHPKNPVLIDIASARPAGRIVPRDGVLIRPVQDCRLGYGAALSLARITQLDDAGYAQTVETTLGPGPSWAGTSLHTLNRSATFEFIDGCGHAPRFGR